MWLMYNEIEIRFPYYLSVSMSLNIHTNLCFIDSFLGFIIINSYEIRHSHLQFGLLSFEY